MSPFGSPAAVAAHLAAVMDFYHPRCIDPSGGYFHFFREDGSVHEAEKKHLVSSARMVINYALAQELAGDGRYRDAMRHGLAFLRQGHRNPRSGGYAWILRAGEVIDDTQHCYGLAFVMMAYAHALKAGLEEVRPWIFETWELLELRFWEEAHGLYADEATADWVLAPYRGQNANMHLCEALIAAWEATRDGKFLRRAAMLGDNMVNRQAALCGGQVWEHYHPNWQVDWNYNKNDRSNIFRPWGLQPGHQLEWARILLQLDRHAPEPWRLPRAMELFEVSMRLAWDVEHGGLIYGYDEQGRPYDSDKYSWVQVEALCTAALLHQHTGAAVCRDWYERVAGYCWRVFVDPHRSCWHRIRHHDNRPWPESAPFSGLTDYHTFSAGAEIIRAGYSLAG